MGEWQPIETAPRDIPVILANFTAACLISGAPHVWTATLVTRWYTMDGKPLPPTEEEWIESSYAATNENGTPTHWMPLPEPPKG